MRVHSLLSFLVCGASTLVVGQELKIPWVEEMMASMTDKYAAAITYNGPTGTALANLAASEASLSSSAVARPTSVAKIIPRASTPYWLEQIPHRGISAFNPGGATYQVFRNVKAYGAIGDGIADDTAAIQNAISSGNRCGPANCESTTTTPAIVYFPAGTYKISRSLIDFYYTQIHGNPNDLPILKATPDFVGFGIIDGDQYQGDGQLGFGPTNTFFRQIRNIVFDITAIPASSEATGLHWPTAQATSLQNCIFKMSDVAGTKHRGIFIEGGSGGFMTDLVFYGGLSGVVFGNQQFTTRNLTFYNAVTAINQLWSWGWTYHGVSTFNCTIGLDMSGGGSQAQNVGSVTLLDSTFTNTKTGIKTAWSPSSLPATAGSLAVENLQLNNVGVGIQGPNSVLLPGGTTLVVGYRQGHTYVPNGANPLEAGGTMLAFPRPASLLNSAKRYFTRSKPQYGDLPVTSFLSARAAGAKGDGVTDDAAVLNALFKTAAAQGKVVFFDSGTYLVRSTLYVPPGSKIVGETYPVIFGAGLFFTNADAPQPIVKVGNAGETGVVEWSDMIVSGRGAMKGAIFIQWNLDSSPANPSGMWDVHTRIGGFAGSYLSLADCPAARFINTPINAPNQLDGDCLAAFMSLHLSKTSQGLYMENVWLWVADHDIEDPELRRLTIYAARGLYSESTKGNFWLWGTSSEHHTFYQYQFVNTPNVFMGQIQTETAYYQPNPKASVPFNALTVWNDPPFKSACSGVSGNCEDGWGLRIVNSTDIFIYGAGLYSFFNNYSTTCSDAGNGASCQTRIFSIEGPLSKRVGIYNLNTVGSQQMATIDGKSFAGYAPNQNVYPQSIAMFRNYSPY